MIAAACAASRSLQSMGEAAAHCAFWLLQSMDATPKEAGTPFSGPELLQNMERLERVMLYCSVPQLAGGLPKGMNPDTNPTSAKTKS